MPAFAATVKRMQQNQTTRRGWTWSAIFSSLIAATAFGQSYPRTLAPVIRSSTHSYSASSTDATDSTWHGSGTLPPVAHQLSPLPQEAEGKLVPTPSFAPSEEDSSAASQPALAADTSGAKPAAKTTLEARINELEKTIKEYDKTFGDMEEQIEGMEELQEEFSEFSSDKTLVHSGSSGSTMKVSGRIHIDYWGFPKNDQAIDVLEGGPDGPQSRLGFRRLRFGVSGKLTSNMLYKIEMEFAGGNNSEFRDAYFGWSDLPLFQTVLIGNQKRPYGLDHLNSSRYNVFLERPFVIEAFNQDARRLGIQSYSHSEDLRWNWRYGVFNQRLIQDEGQFVSDNLQLELASRMGSTFWYDEISGGRGYGHIAFSHSYAKPDGKVGGDNGSTGPDQNEARFRHRPEARSATRWLDTGRIAGTEDYHLYALEGVLNFGALQLVAEGQYIDLNRDNQFGPDLDLWGAYVYASYFLTGEHMPWKRSNGTLDRIKPFEDFFLVDTLRGIGSGWGAWQVAARYSHADFNDGDIFGGVGEAATLGLNWYWTANSRMQFNWVHGRIKDNQETRDESLTGRYDILGARFMVDF